MAQHKEKILSALRLAIGVGVLAYLSVSDVIVWSAFRGLHTAWHLTLSAFVLLLCAIVTTSWRLSLLLRPYGFNLALPASIRLTLIGNFFNFCLPGSAGGDVVRVYYATIHNEGRKLEIGTVMVIDRVIGMFTMLLLPLLIAPLAMGLLTQAKILVPLLWGAAAICLGMCISTMLILTPHFMGYRFVQWIIRHPRLGLYAKRIFETVRMCGRHRTQVGIAIALSLFSQSLVIAVIILIIRAMEATPVSFDASLLIPFGLVANALPITPGGLGVGEAAFETLFSFAGYTMGAETMLGWRLLMMMSGLIGLLFYITGQKRAVFQRQNNRRETPASK